MSVNLTDAIFEQAERGPRVIAVIDGERAIDYRTLCQAVRLAARRFRAAGWKTGDTVGISIRDSPTLHLVSALALARSGIAHATIPGTDSARLRAARIERLGIKGLVEDRRSAASDKVGATVTVDAGWLDAPAGSSAGDDIREPGGGRNWLIIETSGTTAIPKLIGLSHDGEEAQRRAATPIFAHHPGERFLNLSGLRFLTALRRAVYCLSDGGTVTFPRDFTTEALLRWIDLHRVAYVSCVPLHVHQLLRDLGRPDSPRLPGLRILRCGSAALTASAVQDVRRHLTPNLFLFYGASEAGFVTAATPAMLDAHPDTMGLPLPGFEVDIVDDEDRPVARDVPGHVRLRGPGIVTSYLGAVEPEQARAFRNGWFYPGDIAVRNGAGLLFHKGRSDDVMNFDGVLVGPAEIESVLRQHPDVQDVAAFAVPSPEHQEIPAAAIVSDRPVNAAQLAQYCGQRLGARSPRVFIQVSALPRNAMGKILRSRLAELVARKRGEPGRR